MFTPLLVLEIITSHNFFYAVTPLLVFKIIAAHNFFNYTNDQIKGYIESGYFYKEKLLVCLIQTIHIT